MTSASSASGTWNGGVCGTCAARYLGSHACSQDDILRRVRELQALLPGTEGGRVPGIPGAGCPCKPENGGSGVCGGIFGGLKVTC